MTALPLPGEHVYVRLFDRVAPLKRREEDWFVLDFGDGKAAVTADELVVASKHAVRRWRSRIWEPDDEGPDAHEEIVTRWASGAEIPPGHGLECREARLDEETGAVLLLRDNVVATVIAPDGRKPALRDAIDGMGAGA